MVSIVIASSRRGDPSRPLATWADLIMAANSVTLYAPSCELVVAWKGPCPPEGLLRNPRLVIVRQPEAARSYGEAYQFAVEQASGDELILLNDDAVLLPDTVPTLLEDVSLLRRHRPPVKPGFVACRSNVAPGPQNIRSSNGGTLHGGLMRWSTEQTILAADRVSPIAAWIERRALEEIGGFPPINWFSDDLMCFDLARRGYTHFVSRAYVHHVGMRATTEDGTTPQQLLEEGLAWVRRHRPDFLAAVEGTKQPRTPTPADR